MRGKATQLQQGQRFGRWILLRRTTSAPEGSIRWLCRCQCGTVKSVKAHELNAGHTQSCGCAQFVHGETQLRTVEYRAWNQLCSRCRSPRDKAYKDYGGRGIKVCDQWQRSYLAFLADVGRRPTPLHSLDRIDNNGDYRPGNVRWTTRRQQQNNMRSNRHLTFHGLTLTVAQWARRINISKDTLTSRLRYGWSVEATLTTAVDIRCRHRQR